MGQIQLQRESLGEGIFFNRVPSRIYKTDYLHLYFSLPLTKENASLCALLSRVLLRGSEHYPHMRTLNRALDACYSANLETDVFKCGESQVLSVSASCLADEYALDGESINATLTEILSDVLFCPLLRTGELNEAILNSEKQNACDTIAAQINNKMSYARKRMYEVMCAEEAYGVDPLGEEERIRAISAQELCRFHERVLREAQVEIFHVGRSDASAVKETFRKHFASIPRAPLPRVVADSLVSAPPIPRKVRETGEVTQANLVLGFRTGITLLSDNYSAFTLFNAVLGGSLTSKLFVNVREKLSLCYSIGSRPDTAKGVMAVACGIDPQKYEEAKSEILRQLELTRQGEITHAELEQSTNALLNALVGLEDTPSAIADWFYPRVLAGDLRTPAQVAEALHAVTKEQVAAAAKAITLDTVYLLEGEGKEEQGE
jgi:predicted Zn-dependent peptidase